MRQRGSLNEKAQRNDAFYDYPLDDEIVELVEALSRPDVCHPLRTGVPASGSIANARGFPPGMSCFRGPLRPYRASTAPLPTWSASCRKLRRWASTFCTCRPFIPSGAPFAKARRTRRPRNRAMWAAPGPSATSRWRPIRRTPTASRKMMAATSRFIPSWEPMPISITSWPPRKAHGMEIALDIAFQCSPDHPWVTEHPTWFNIRPDGSIQYAENPPKKYQDIYPAQFRVARLARALGRAVLGLRVLDQARRERVPRGQSAHQGHAVLGVVPGHAADANILTPSFSPKLSRGRT